MKKYLLSFVLLCIFVPSFAQIELIAVRSISAQNIPSMNIEHIQLNGAGIHIFAPSCIKKSQLIGLKVGLAYNFHKAEYSSLTDFGRFQIERNFEISSKQTKLLLRTEAKFKKVRWFSDLSIGVTNYKLVGLGSTGQSISHKMFTSDTQNLGIGTGLQFRITKKFGVIGSFLFSQDLNKPKVNTYSYYDQKAITTRIDIGLSYKFFGNTQNL